MLIHRNIQGYMVEDEPSIAHAIPPIHNSEQSAYIIDDYPYSFNLRCEMRIWLEFDPKRGYRFCRQTLNPKTERWNAPKKETYVEYVAFIYEGTDGQTRTLGLSRYSSPEEIRDFLEKYSTYLEPERVEWLKKRAVEVEGATKSYREAPQSAR